MELFLLDKKRNDENSGDHDINYDNEDDEDNVNNGSHHIFIF